MKREKIIIIGAGPCGLSAAIALQDRGYDPLIIEKGNVVHSIFHYPTHQQFFSTSEKLAIGNVPFYSTERKPKRNEALVYYREVVNQKGLRINTYEKVTSVDKQKDGHFIITGEQRHGKVTEYETDYLVVATGYYDSPNMMGIPGEEYDHVFHYFKEAHPFFNQNVAIIGGKNSAVDAALALHNVGAKPTVIYRGETYSKSIKPWILPEFDALVQKKEIDMIFEAEICEITKNEVIYKHKGNEKKLPADFVFAMTGYHPDHSFIKKMGVEVDDDTGRPVYDCETMETNVENIFIAGVIAAGNNANEIFIENGRHHGAWIAEEIERKNADQ
ncbi:YpdA family putative bacillithiol disulfide reductase [Texcoconibacillus texcoconensis]|uniref:Thioredoxin reductase (NADPH) n=1 Tax=Texcoconibacillus texcoconensis TaxID=1095777 RepID=A0A840QNI7_9BACI|nr:thioredoxin reductase (NADPH) [Texcoconibacillus texcoconensis]